MILSADSLLIGYGGSSSPLCREMSFTIPEGQCILLCGANGSGKSTLMKTISGMIPPLGGKITLHKGETVMIPTGIPKVKGFTLEEFIRTGFYSRSSWSGRVGKSERENILSSMERLGISHLAGNDISRLSDGEFQKGCIASALSRMKCSGGGLLLLDEPTAFLDVDSRSEVLRALKQLCLEEGVSVIFSSHDIHDSVKEADRVLALKDGLMKDSVSADENMSTAAWAFSSMSHLGKNAGE